MKGLVEHIKEQEYVDEGLLSNIKSKVTSLLLKTADKLALTQVPEDAVRQINMKIDDMENEITEYIYSEWKIDKDAVPQKTIHDILTQMQINLRFGNQKSGIDIVNMIWLGYFFSEQGRKDWSYAKKNEGGIFTSDMMMGASVGRWLKSENFNGFKDMMVELCAVAIAKEAGIEVDDSYKDKYKEKVHSFAKK